MSEMRSSRPATRFAPRFAAWIQVSLLGFRLEVPGSPPLGRSSEVRGWGRPLVWPDPAPMNLDSNENRCDRRGRIPCPGPLPLPTPSPRRPLKGTLSEKETALYPPPPPRWRRRRTARRVRSGASPSWARRRAWTAPSSSSRPWCGRRRAPGPRAAAATGDPGGARAPPTPRPRRTRTATPRATMAVRRDSARLGTHPRGVSRSIPGGGASLCTARPTAQEKRPGAEIIRPREFGPRTAQHWSDSAQTPPNSGHTCPVPA